MGFLPLLPFQLILLCDVMKNYGWKISTTLQFYFIAGMFDDTFCLFHSEHGFLYIFWLQGWPQQQVYHGKNLPFLDALIVNNDPKFFSNQNLP